MQSEEEGKDQESIQPNTTSGHHEKVTKHMKHHIQKSKEVSPFPAGDPKTARNRQDSMADKHETQITKMIRKNCKPKVKLKLSKADVAAAIFDLTNTF